MANIILGVTGSVAAYRACDLARELKRSGHDVRVCLTPSAERFVSRALFEALTGNVCLVDVFDEPERGRMAHIDWARWADLILVAPCTANTLADLAYGLAVGMLGTVVSASNAKLVVAPAMNPAMYSSDQNQQALNNILKLRTAGALIIEPAEGDVACGENGQGKLASNAEIVQVIEAIFSIRRVWKGKTVVVTSGPTREPIDDVRFISNKSSGKMGRAVAQTLAWAGADVRVVSGPVDLIYPGGFAEYIRVNTANEMLEACIEACKDADVFIGVAAVSDYRPAQVTRGKLRRTEKPLHIELVPNPDIVASIAKHFPQIRTYAFAAEPDAGLDEALAKMKRKGVRAIAVNDISKSDSGFDSDFNQLTLLWSDGRKEVSPHAPKSVVAAWLVNQLSSDCVSAEGESPKV